MKNRKPKVAFYDLTGCNGCLYTILNHPALLSVDESVDIQKFRLASDVDEEGPFDAAIVEGYASVEEDFEMLEEIREKSDRVIALGSCASYGSIHSLRNFLDVEEAKEEVYPDNPGLVETPKEAVSIDEHIEVDLKIPGCPPNADEAVELIADLVFGKMEPELSTWPVCVDCKMNGNVCVLIHGIPCLGPVTRGGCGAPCPQSYTCDGCRGPKEEPNISSLVEKFKEFKDEEEIKRLFKRYASSSRDFSEVFKGEIDD